MPQALSTPRKKNGQKVPHSVSNVFSQVRVVNEELYRKTLEEIVRSLDKMENANIPSVSLSKREVGKTQTC